jgi:hypothetical protein
MKSDEDVRRHQDPPRIQRITPWHFFRKVDRMRSSTLPSLSFAFVSAVSLAAVGTAVVACSSSSDDEGAASGDAGGGTFDSSVPPGPGNGDGGTSPGDDGGGTAPSDGGSLGDSAVDGGAPLTDDGCTVTLPGDCDAPVAAYSLNARIVTAYPSAAPLFRVVRIPDLAATNVLQAGQGSFAGGGGTPDVTQVKAWLASAATANSTAVVVTVFDQSGHGNDAVQTVAGAAPLLRIDDGVPAASALSMIFGNDTASVQQGYAHDATVGSLLTIASLRGANPALLTFAPSPPPTLPNQPPGSPFPQLPTPDHWILPGFLIQDRSLPSAGLPVVSATKTSLTLAGQPTETSTFSNAITVVPSNTWLDLPAGVSVDGAHHTMVTAVRSGSVGTQELLTLGETGEAIAGAGPYSSLYGASGPFTLLNETQTAQSGGTALVPKGTISTDIDVYAVSRDGADVDFDLGEMGSGTVTDNAQSTAKLTSGSIGYTQQISAKNAGSFEGYGVMVYGAAISPHDAALFRASFRGLLDVPVPSTTQIVYSGASTVIGHGIDSVEAPTKRIGVDLAAAGHPTRTFVSEDFSEALLTDLTTGGPVSRLYKQGTGLNVLAIHPTLGDSFRNYLSGQIPAYCTTLEPDGGLDLAQCLWSTVSKATAAAHKMGWKVLIVSGEPKADILGGTDGTLADLLELKQLEVAGWKAAGADGYLDLETVDAIGGSDGKGNPSHCPFWRSACIPGYLDTTATEVNWQPDGQHLTQAGYDASADAIAKALLAMKLY